jgi:Response regulator containing a CheY-like receiver domain and an HTH DNA-binding domain
MKENRRNQSGGKGENQISAYEIAPVGESFLPFDECLVDRMGKQFACIHKQCQSFPSCFRNGDLPALSEFHELVFHPEDRKLWCEATFPDILRFIYTEDICESSDYRVIFNHRYIRKDHTVSQFMHEGVLLFQDAYKIPVLNLKIFAEIADLKQDETMILTIFKYIPEVGYTKVFSKSYRKESESYLSGRELEIIALCHEGLSSKMIAERLNLSIHTVKNHKRNCMAKTNTHNITELIHLCIRSGWL